MSCCKGKQGGGMGGKSCCVGPHGGSMHGGGDTAALEQRINELEKRLGLMHALLQRKTR